MADTAGTDPTATNYSDSAHALRSSLMGAHNLHTSRMELPTAGDEGRHGHMMAASYSYTLAALLGWVGRTYGTEALRDAASLVDEVLTNGDFDDLNADLTDGTAEELVAAFTREAGDLTAEFTRTISDARQGVPSQPPYVLVDPADVAAALADRTAGLLETARRDRAQAAAAGWTAACQQISDRLIARRDNDPRREYQMGLEDGARIARATEPPADTPGG